MQASVVLGTWVLLLGQVIPVFGECDPSHAVVAVASVLSTLGFVMIVLAVAYLVVRRRRAVTRSLKFGDVRDKEGHVNSAFVNDGYHDTGGTLRGENSLHTKNAMSGLSNEKTWSSLPRKDKFIRLSKEGSYSSLNGNYSSTDPEVISVTLESQDIIGLGFNICGGFNDGIQVSEVNSRGPAKENGNIKVGDRILSVTVCYEHIVYEDALTILSYASPYPVKIRLQKSTGENIKKFDGKRIKVGSRRLSHPLFRSRSLEAVKSSGHKEAPSRSSHPKRTQSDLKSGHKLLKWPGKHSRKEKSSPTKEDPASFKWPASKQINVDIEHSKNSDKELGVRLSRIQDTFNSDNEEDDQFSMVKQPALQSDKKLATSSTSSADSCNPKVAPDKPERKNRRKSDVPFSPKEVPVLDSMEATNTNTLSFTPPSSESANAKVIEELIVPEMIQRADIGKEDEQKPEADKRDIKGALDILRKFAFKDDQGPIRSPSPDAEPVEEEIILPETKSGHGLLTSAPIVDMDSSNNNVKLSTDSNKPKTLNDEILEMIIAMNSFPPGTQGYAGLTAGGQHGGVVDDFIPNNLGFVPQPVPKSALSKHLNDTQPQSESETPVRVTSPVLNNARSVAYEIRDDLVTGQPFAVEINKQRQHKTGNSRPIVRSASDQVMHDQTRVSPLHTSLSFDASTGHPLPTFDNATWSMDIGDELSDSGNWTGHKLKRTDSFENIYINE
ncbi:periaxin [Biomphalaria glabrata]